MFNPVFWMTRTRPLSLILSIITASLQTHKNYIYILVQFSNICDLLNYKPMCCCALA